MKTFAQNDVASLASAVATRDRLLLSRRAALGDVARVAGLCAAAAYGLPAAASAEEPAAPAPIPAGEAGAPTVPWAHVELCGDWDCGYWKSACRSHEGKLRATIWSCGSSRYECRFAGTFLKLVPFRYTVPLVVTSRGDGIVHFQATKKIPLFGNFTACGYATACRFHADYTAQDDRGVFVMSRT